MGSPLDVLLPANQQKVNPLDELLITPSGPVSNGTGAIGGYEQGVKDFVSNISGLGEGAVHLMQNPDEISEVAGAGASAIGDAVMHPLHLVKGIFWDGIIKPVVVNNVRLAMDSSLSEEDKFKLARESSLAMTGLAIGEGVGRVLGGLGKGVAAAKQLKMLTKAGTVEGMIDAVSTTLTPQEALQASVLAQAKLKGSSYFKSAMRTAPIGAGSGFAMGVAQTNDPNEAFKSGLINGMVGAFLGPVFHSVARGSKKGYQVIRDVGLERARDDMYSTLLEHSPDLTLEQTLNGVNFVKVGAANLPAGQGFVFHNVPDKFDLSAYETKPVAGIGAMEQAVRGKIVPETPEMVELGAQLAQIRRQYEPAELSPEQAAKYNTIANKLEALRQEQEAKLPNRNVHVRVNKDGSRSVLVMGESAKRVVGDVNKTNPERVELYRQLESTGDKLRSVQEVYDSHPTGSAEKVEALGNMIDIRKEKAGLEEKIAKLNGAEKVPVDPALMVQSWKETGFVPSQLISFKGVDHEFLGVEKGFAKVRDLSSGKIQRTSLKNLEPSSGRVHQVEYKPEEEILLGKRFTHNVKPGLFAVLSRNTKVGEQPWRTSMFMQNEQTQGKMTAIGHRDFPDSETALKSVTATPGSLHWQVDNPGHKPLSPADQAKYNFAQNFIEVDSKSKMLPASLRTAETPLEVKQFPEIVNKEFMDAMKDHPDELAAYHKNVESIVTEQMNDAGKISESLASYGVMAQRASNGALELRDASGTFIDAFTNVDELYKYARGLTGNGGDLVPGVPGVRSIGFDDSSSFALNQKRNLVNAMRDWLAQRASGITTPYSYFTTLATKYGKDFFNAFYLPLQHARSAYNVRAVKLAEYINPLLMQLSKFSVERRGIFSNAIETFSPEQMLSDKPSILARALSEKEKRIGIGLAEISTHDDRIAAYQYIRQEADLAKSLKGVSKSEAARLEADFKSSVTDQLTDAQRKVIKIQQDIRGESFDEVGIYAVNRLADAIEGKHLSREDYMNVNKFNPEERDILDKISKTYSVLAGEFEIDPGSRLGGYITHAVKYDGKVVDGSVITNSRFLSSKTRDFVYAMVRTGEMQDLIRDPGELLKRYVIQGVKSAELYPELTKANQWLQTALVGMTESEATAVYARAKSYMRQIVGQMDPVDALVSAETVQKASGAFVDALKRVGIDDSVTDKWLKNYLKTSELATQGFKPIAGLRDATSTMMYWFARFGVKRTLSMMRDWNTAMDTKGIMQLKGLIPGLNLEFFTGIDGALRDQTFLDRAAETGFKFSGQPFVYQQFHAMSYINTLKTVMSAASELESKKITQAVFEKKIGLSTYDQPVVKEFVRLLKAQPVEAAKYLADITGREMVGYYGMANHPFFMSSKMGKVLGQHGQWPLWMIQNFGRLASQGNRLQRVGTAVKIAAMMGAIRLGGQAAGFNLGSWTFSPDNAIFNGGPVAQTAMWGSLYFGSNDPGTREYAGYMLQRQSPINFTKAEGGITNPYALTRSQYYIPMPSQFYNIGWGLARASRNDPLWIVGGQMLGIPIDQKQYPK